MVDKNKKTTGSKLDKIIMGAVVGAAIGSVLGVSLAPKSGKETREDIVNQFDKIKDFGDNKSRWLLRRLRLYLKKRNERKKK